MEIWSEIGKKLNSAADYTAKETEKLTGIAKITYKLSGCKTKLAGLYQELGKLKYAECRGQEAEEGAGEALVARIDELIAEIAQMETELAVLRNYKFCIACGTKLRGEMVYCPKCGAKQLPVPEEEPEEAPAEEAPAEEAPAEEAPVDDAPVGSDAEETVAGETDADSADEEAN